MDRPIPKPFIVYPAIDLRGGKVVRLSQGDPERQTTYEPEPEAAAARWLAAGAEWLHVVNLDNAFGEASPENVLGPGSHPHGHARPETRLPPPARRRFARS